MAEQEGTALDGNEVGRKLKTDEGLRRYFEIGSAPPRRKREIVAKAAAEAGVPDGAIRR